MWLIAGLVFVSVFLFVWALLWPLPTTEFELYVVDPWGESLGFAATREAAEILAQEEIEIQRSDAAQDPDAVAIPGVAIARYRLVERWEYEPRLSAFFR